jgi:hypothetical protein
MLIASKTLENMEGATRNGQSIDRGSIAQKETASIPNIIKQPTNLEQYHSKKPLTEKVAWFMMFNATFNNISVISSPPTRKDNSNYKLSYKM